MSIYAQHNSKLVQRCRNKIFTNSISCIEVLRVPVQHVLEVVEGPVLMALVLCPVPGGYVQRLQPHVA